MAAWQRLTVSKSLSPALLSRHSTTALPLPVGRLIGRHSGPNVSWICATSASRSTSGDVDLVDDDRARQVAVLGGLHHAAGDDLDPLVALTTTATVSTAGRHAMAGPIRSGEPGVSMRLMRLPRWSTCRTTE